MTNIGDQSTEVDLAPNDVIVAIDLDTGFNESTFVSAVATSGVHLCAQPVVRRRHRPESSATRRSSAPRPRPGSRPAAGTTVTVVANVDTALPSYVDFDVAVDPATQVAEFREANNTGGLRVDVLAP